MRLGINLTKIQFGERSGIGNYAISLVGHLIKEQKRIVIFTFEKIETINGFKNVDIVKTPQFRNNLLYFFWFQFIFPLVLLREGVDVIFNPSFFTLIFCPTKQVTTIHDCSARKYKEFLSPLSKVYYVLNFYITKFFADSVVTISEFSKKELVRNYHYNPKKVLVNYPSIPSTIQGKNIIQMKFKKPYFVYIGNMRERKNLPGLINAFKIVSEKNRSVNLVIIGKKESKFVDVDDLVKIMDLKKRVIITGFVYDEEKKYIIKNSLALVFPTFYEGFGLPVLEAQSLGVPVLTSNTSSLPEVGGESVLYVNPYEVADIAKGMEKLLKDAIFRKSLIRKGKENLRRFSWEKSAKELVSIFEEIVNENS